MAERHPEQDVLVDLALGEVDGPEQDALARHLATCDACRSDYAAVAAGLEHVLTAAPRTPPPPGFDARALAAMGFAERTPHGPPAGTSQGRRAHASRGRRGAPDRGPAPAVHAGGGGPSRPGGRRRRTLLVTAAAAVLGIAVGAGAATVLDGAPDEASSSAVSSGTPLRTVDGDVVGQVTTGVQQGAEVLVVDITGAPEGAAYDCRVLRGDGDPLHAGRWTLRAGGPTVWVIPAPEGASGVELVTDAGTVWSEASL